MYMGEHTNVTEKLHDIQKQGRTKGSLLDHIAIPVTAFFVATDLMTVHLYTESLFDELVRLKAQQLAISSLVETRYQHHASALNLQADLRLQVENLRASKKLIEEQLADVNARIQKLEA